MVYFYFLCDDLPIKILGCWKFKNKTVWKKKKSRKYATWFCIVLIVLQFICQMWSGVWSWHLSISQQFYIANFFKEFLPHHPSIPQKLNCQWNQVKVNPNFECSYSHPGIRKTRSFNLFTTIHDGNFRRHSSMNVTIKWHKFSSNIYYIYVFFVIWSCKLR